MPQAARNLPGNRVQQRASVAINQNTDPGTEPTQKAGGVPGGSELRLRSVAEVPALHPPVRSSLRAWEASSEVLPFSHTLPSSSSHISPRDEAEAHTSEIPGRESPTAREQGPVRPCPTPTPTAAGAHLSRSAHPEDTLAPAAAQPQHCVQM